MKTLNKKNIYIILATLFAGILIGALFFGENSKDASSKNQEQVKNTIWTCSMHPQIRQAEFGLCPLCGMDLIPLDDESSDGDPMEIRMSPSAMQIANIQTSVISKQKAIKEIRVNGKVKADEREVFSQSSHISGRIEKLLINYTGEYVTKGQEIAYIYSPELVSAQEELLEAYKMKNVQAELYMAAREKLKNWKLTEQQIDGIIQSGVLIENFPILSDLTGVVLTKRVNLGDHIKQGQSLFEVADLDKVWILFDVYESDLYWVKKGNEVSFTIQSIPGESFKGNITFIDPIINPKTRVATARVEIDNRGRNLKPDMFALGEISSKMKNNTQEIIVPKSAVMWTGERSVVYLKTPSVSGVSFLMREVILGASLGGSYIIKEGLKEGDEIATNGTFSIDAAAQLAGKPSMMNPFEKEDIYEEKEIVKIAINAKSKQTLSPIFDDYFSLKNALSSDNFEQSEEIVLALLKTLNKVNMSVFTGESHNVWMQFSKQTTTILKQMKKSENIKKQRTHFIKLSKEFIVLIQTFGAVDKTIYQQFCPMANNNKGADWLSNSKEIKNPYFGKSMLKCGEIKQTIK
ncbi:MAG: efflux RND transporter periplasmic adaptor subunit [Flavobacteriales bacterium]|nr:efflux RND transporter periplasmic adaptor subunit [Flavobacteriales bacterium]